jgi:hypothetical protein
MVFRRARRTGGRVNHNGDSNGAHAPDVEEDDGARLDDAEHAWWSQRERIELHTVRHTRYDVRPPRTDLDDPWSIEKLFDFVPSYGLDLESVPEPEPEPTTWPEDDEDVPLPEGLFRADDPYAVLGVPSTATWEEITFAHRRLARLHHPDRLIDTNPTDRERSENRMRDVNVAYVELRRRRGR